MSDGSSDRLSPQMVRVALVSGFGALLLNIDATALNVALDPLIADLHTTLSVAQWTITGYLLSLTLVLPLFRFLAERIGMKRLYVASLLGFTAASLLCASAWSVGSLIAFRLLQGAIGGLLTPIAQALTARHANERQIGRLLSIVAIPVLVAPLLGPLLGGALVVRFSWRAIFFINVPLGLGGALLAGRVLPADEAGARATGRLDVVGLLLLSPGMVCFIYGVTRLNRGSGHGELLHAILPFVLAVALVATFFGRARRAPATSLLDLRLFGQRVIAAALVAYVLISMVSFGGQLLLPLYYEQVRGRSPLSAGLLLAPQGLGMMLTLPRIGRLTDRHDPGRLTVIGVLVTLLGTVAFAFAVESPSLWLLGASLVVRGAGLGASTNPALSTVYRRLPKSEVANATTALNVVQRIGAPLGTSMMAVLLDWRVSVSATPAQAFGQTFTACVVLSALTILPACFLIGESPLSRERGPRPPIERPDPALV